jgi:hypothetical protein
VAGIHYCDDGLIEKMQTNINLSQGIACMKFFCAIVFEDKINEAIVKKYLQHFSFNLCLAFIC